MREDIASACTKKPDDNGPDGDRLEQLAASSETLVALLRHNDRNDDTDRYEDSVEVDSEGTELENILGG
jgi:hypothetical protein